MEHHTDPCAPRRLVVIGSSGSIGRNALEVVADIGGFTVTGLSVGRQVTELAEQVERFRPAMVAIASETAARGVIMPGVVMKTGETAASELLATLAPDCCIIATPGLESLPLARQALNLGATVYLATKESAAVAGDLLMADTTRPDQLVPIDSELTALWFLRGILHPGAIDRLWISASGGPFKGLTRQQLARKTPEQALHHPRWRMGPKVSVDSASMVNKAIELIAAARLFCLRQGQVHASIHPQSHAHAAAVLKDGSTLALLSDNDMRVTIARALSGPGSTFATGLKPLDLSGLELSFTTAVSWQQAMLDLAARAAGHRMAAIALVAADQAGVEAFLNGRVRFDQLLDLVQGLVEDALAELDRGFDPRDYDREIMAQYAHFTTLATRRLEDMT